MLQCFCHNGNPSHPFHLHNSIILWSPPVLFKCSNPPLMHCRPFSVHGWYAKLSQWRPPATLLCKSLHSLSYCDRLIAVMQCWATLSATDTCSCSSAQALFLAVDVLACSHTRLTPEDLQDSPLLAQPRWTLWTPPTNTSPTFRWPLMLLLLRWNTVKWWVNVHCGRSVGSFQCCSLH